MTKSFQHQNPSPTSHNSRTKLPIQNCYLVNTYAFHPQNFSLHPLDAVA